ncbi:fatty acid desaturase [bacterium]|nr:fatty acid desaturase [bacterium]
MNTNRKILKKFREHNSFQIIYVLSTSLLAYIALLFIAYQLSFYSYWWVLVLALPTHWFHARIFILMHDCGHYSFFKNRKLNTLFGHIAGFFYYTPFLMWRELHNKHHTNQGNLDKRGLSLDVWTMTKTEFESCGKITKSVYKIYRNPFVVLFLSPLILFFVIFRLPFEKFSTKATANILILDILLISAAFYFPQQTLTYFLIQLPSLLLSFSMASFLFYVQHQFENTRWVNSTDYSNELISLHGSSYFKLPVFFDWAYGFIGYHHIHHLDVKIPMYHLKAAHLSLNSLHTEITLSDALKSLNLKVWDEAKSKLVSVK